MSNKLTGALVVVDKVIDTGKKFMDVYNAALTPMYTTIPALAFTVPMAAGGLYYLMSHPNIAEEESRANMKNQLTELQRKIEGAQPR